MMTKKSVRPNLIIILGKPATGKTTLSKEISSALNLPIVCRDSVKEIIFDGLGWTDRDWSMKVGRTSFEIVDYIVEQQLKAGNSIIVETPYNPKFENKKFQQWQKQYNINIIQVLCHADPKVLAKRFEIRSKSPERHPGHVDEGNVEEFNNNIDDGRVPTLDVECAVIEVDTTDFSKIDKNSIINQIRAVL